MQLMLVLRMASINMLLIFLTLLWSPVLCPNRICPERVSHCLIYFHCPVSSLSSVSNIPYPHSCLHPGAQTTTMEWHFNLSDDTARELKVHGRGERLQAFCRSSIQQYGTSVTIAIAPPGHAGELRSATISGPAEGCQDAWRLLTEQMLPQGSHHKERKELQGGGCL
jgi:hypothetical protein